MLRQDQNDLLTRTGPGTPMGDLAGPVEMVAKSPNKMRMAVSMDLSSLGAQGEIHIEQLFDGVTGWSINSMQGDQQLSGAQLEGAKNSYFPSPLLNYKEHGMTIALESAIRHASGHVFLDKHIEGIVDVEIHREIIDVSGRNSTHTAGDDVGMRNQIPDSIAGIRRIVLGSPCECQS